MVGCVVVQFFHEGLPPCSLPVKSNASKWTTELELERLRQVQFDVDAAARRLEIDSALDRVAAVLERVHNRALIAFDAQVDEIRKRMAIELVSLEVYANQAAAGCDSFGAHETVDGVDLVNAPPTFVHVPLEDLETVLGCCWELVPSSQLVNDECSQDMLEKFPEQVKYFVETQTTVQLLKNMVQAATVAFETAKANEVVARKDVVPCWQGKIAAAYPLQLKVAGLAVNSDASLFAVSSYDLHRVQVHALPSGDVFTAFGTKGSNPGQFDGPLRLCFTSRGTLLVADSANKRVQEVTTAGAYERYIGDGVFRSLLMHVTCNADIIVAADSSNYLPVYVFDMTTGMFLRNFGRVGIAPGSMGHFWDTAVSADGTKVLVADYTNCRVSVFDLNGNFMHMFGDQSTLNNIETVAELPDGRIVVAADTDTYSPRLAIFPQLNCSVSPTQTVTPSYVEGFDSVDDRYHTCLQLRFSNKFLFFAARNVVYCLS